jgi:hypothetical protein
MDRSTDQIERDLARTRGDIDRTVGLLEEEARSRVQRLRSGAFVAAVAAAAGLLIIATIRRLRGR